MQDDALGRQLEIGAFYWVIPAFDTDASEEWERGMQPARYAGNGACIASTFASSVIGLCDG